MAVDFLLSQDGDIDLTNNTMTLTQDTQTSSRQQALIELRSFRGEWVFNTNSGIPYLVNDNNSTKLLGKSSKSLLDFYIKEAILGRENITEIREYSSSLDTDSREATISFKALTNSGDVVEVINAPVA